MFLEEVAGCDSGAIDKIFVSETLESVRCCRHHLNPNKNRDNANIFQGSDTDRIANPSFIARCKIDLKLYHPLPKIPDGFILLFPKIAYFSLDITPHLL
jgi:hypothetical protein